MTWRLFVVGAAGCSLLIQSATAAAAPELRACRLPVVTANMSEGDNAGLIPRWIPPAAPEGARSRMTPIVANTLTDKKVELVPKDGNTIRWYICGPTVYDSSHLGHARTYVAFDVIRRILENFFGYDIFCVMNVTDVDDKIILRARRNHLLKQYRESSPSLEKVIEDGFAELAQAQTKFEAKRSALEAKIAAETRSGQKKGLEEELNGVTYKHKLVEAQGVALAAAKAGEIKTAPVLLDKVGDLIAAKLDGEKGGEVRDQDIFRAHAAYYEQEYLEDMKALGVRPPDVLTRVTEFMPEIVKYIEKIIANGFAYATTSGDVYFDIRAFQKEHAYRKLSYNAATTAEQLAEGEGALSSGDGKKHENDFALWKSSKPGEPGWDSPWGGGTCQRDSQAAPGSLVARSLCAPVLPCVYTCVGVPAVMPGVLVWRCCRQGWG